MTDSQMHQYAGANATQNAPAKGKRRRNRPGNFAGYGKPSFPRARPYPFEWGQINNG